MIYLFTGPVSAAEGGLYVWISFITGPADLQLWRQKKTAGTDDYFLLFRISSPLRPLLLLRILRCLLALCFAWDGERTNQED